MTFKRNQVEEALWHYMSRDHTSQSPPTVFRTRIKRLLEIDRATSGTDEHPMAFADTAPKGRGNEVKFKEFDVFCLGIGLLMLNAGFKQAEIVVLLQHIRDELAKIWRDIQECPPEPRHRLPAKDRPQAPTYKDGFVEYADTDVYLIVNSVELKEVFAEQDPKAPIIFMPFVCYGAEALGQKLRTNALSLPASFVMELSILAVRIQTFLGMAEPRLRGPG